ncbi:glycoside hydrolase family 127 protein [Nonomuraea sp. M3C6]|uniref:Glycoside hydrolase family 127 protein n=1 Tax=Nonomuraea marmarensis TaxID=3351344 RepID=A0ABW7AAN1_9ACTN
MTTDAPLDEIVAPCSPRSGARLALRPISIGRARVTGGYWARWQRDNRAVTTPHALRWLEKDGVLDNFRRLVDSSVTAERRGWVFCDSDLYKVLEGIGWDLSRGPSAELSAFVAHSVALLEQVQGDDGYLNTFVQAGLEQRYANLTRGHELYCAGHLIQAGIALTRTTGDESLLAIGRRFADHLVAEFGDGRRGDTDGHPEIETALVELYRHTRERDYLDLAKQLIDVRGHGVIGAGPFGPAYFQDTVPVRDQHTVVGHAVRALYLLAGVVDVYLETGEDALLHAAQSQWRSMVAEKTYLTGAVGSRFEGEAFGDRFELPPDLSYGETCASIAGIMLSWRLLLATGDGAYADLIERILYNAFSGSTSVSRDGFCYVNPLQRRSPRPAAPAGGKPLRTDAPGTRAEWFDVACCPPNIMRTIASLDGYLATTDDHGIQLHLYTPSSVHTELAAGEVAVSVATEYPEDGVIAVTVERSITQPWTLSLRVPSWCHRPALIVAGEHVPVERDARGYVVVERVWAPGDVVVLDLPMPARVTAAHPAVDAVRGQVAIERGPVVFCLESVGGELDLDTVELLVGGDLRVERDEELFGGTTVVRLDGRLRDDSAWQGVGWSDVSEIPASSGRPQEVTAIPYRLWANRGPSTMRVWVPAAHTG